MADTKQATTETVCEHCGLTLRMFLGSWVSDVGSSTSVFCPERTSRMSPLPHVPRTQPSQELRIPDDLKGLYQSLVDAAHEEGGGEWTSDEDEITARLIERIARLEGAIRWANGEVDEFRERKPGEGAYWWRKELMRRARLEGSR